MSNRVTGVSLVETSVALALGVILSLAAMAAYLSAKRDFLLHRQLAEVQDAGRLALRVLRRDVGLSGFFGGLPPGDAALAPPPGQGCVEGWALNPTVGLEVLNDVKTVEKAGPGLLTCLDIAGVLPGTDVLAVKRTATEPALLDGVVAPNLRPSDTARWYLETSEAAPPAWRKLTSSAIRVASRDAGTSLWRVMSSIYFVRPWAVRAGDGIPTLCVDTLAGSRMPVRCLAEGVEDLQVQFGFDTDGDGVINRYGDAAGSELSRVITVRIQLVIRSIDPVSGVVFETRDDSGLRAHAASGDGYLRRVITSTVALDARLVALSWLP